MNRPHMHVRDRMIQPIKSSQQAASRRCIGTHNVAFIESNGINATTDCRQPLPSRWSGRLNTKATDGHFLFASLHSHKKHNPLIHNFGLRPPRQGMGCLGYAFAVLWCRLEWLRRQCKRVPRPTTNDKRHVSPCSIPDIHTCIIRLRKPNKGEPNVGCGLCWRRVGPTNICCKASKCLSARTGSSGMLLTAISLTFKKLRIAAARAG